MPATHSPPPATDRWFRVLAPVWVLIAAVLFFTQDLPNNPQVNRLDLLTLHPVIVDSALNPVEPAGLRYLLQRFPVFAVAACVGVAACCAGDALLTGLRLRPACPGMRLAMAGGLGLSGYSLMTLLLGLAGGLRMGTAWPLLAVGPAVWLLVRRFVTLETPPDTRCLAALKTPAAIAAFAACVPFAVIILLGAALPSADFDVKEYHLQGPKEWFLAGRIGFLDHNVYTSFPFLTEMHSLLGMTLVDDWWLGALVGKVVLSGFAFLAAAAVWGIASRVDPVVGALAVMGWVTSPWCRRASTIAYAEGGLAFYVVGTLAAMLLAWESKRSGWWLVTGLLAGSGMACKYPGLVQTVIPASLVGIVAWWKGRADWRAAGLFALGVVVAVGPWLLKNLLETGNPVYPLGWSVFGGVGHDAAWAAKWKAAHSPPLNVLGEPLRAVPDFVRSLGDAFVKNDWQTPLVLLFTPVGLATLLLRRPRELWWAAVFGFWLIVMWWALTHRIDRFWVPALPVLCIVAGVGLAWPRALIGTENRVWKPVAWVSCISAFVVNYLMAASALGGLNTFMTDYDSVRRIAQQSNPAVLILNEVLPADSKPLLVGEASVFDAKMPVAYNTVFDASIFQQLTSGDHSPPDGEQPTAAADELCRRLQEAGITHVLVNWGEILRYRAPGSYGYTDYVTPARFRGLMEAGVLRPISLPPEYVLGDWDTLGDAARSEIDAWGPELREGGNWRRIELFVVTCQ